MFEFNDYIGNYSLTCTPEFFGPYKPQYIGNPFDNPVVAETGAFLKPNGDVEFKLHYPKASEVSLALASGRHHMNLNLIKDSEGFFTGTLKYEGDPNWIGLRSFGVIVDGVATVSGRMPVAHSPFGLQNFIYIPDLLWDDYLIKDVPHGTLSYEIYRSKVTDSWQRCMVYTPAEYQDSPDKLYPTLYLHHPGGANETSWMFSGRVPMIMDNLIAEGRALPFIVVTNECGPKLPSDGRFGMDGYIRVLLEECMPFIEKKYRVLTDKWSHASAGSSWGGMLSSRLVFSHPELFASIGMLSSGLRCVDTEPELGDNHYLDWMKGNVEAVAAQYKLIFRSHGQVEYTGRPGVPGENGNPTLLEDEKFLAENGIDKLPCYVRRVYPDLKHMWETFAKGFMEFAELLFK